MSDVSVQGWVRSVLRSGRGLAIALAGATVATTAVAADTETLEEVIVVAGGSQVTLPEAYEGGQIARGGRVGMFGNLDLMDTPFTGVSYTAQLIQDQQAKSVADVLQNDPTVRVARGFGNFQELYIIRGFPVYSDDVTYNGVYGILPRQYVAAELLERVEVFRGANTFLNGAAPGGSGVGGAFNLVPKRAADEPLARVTLGFENEGQAYGAIDVGQRFAGETTGVRLNLVRRDGETSVDDQERELSVAALGMDFRGEQLRLSADLGYQDHRIDAPRPSVTPLGDIPETPEASSNFAQPWTYTSERQLFGVVRGEYDFTQRVSLWVAAGARDGEEFNILANPNAFADGVTSSYRFDNKREEDLYSADAGLRVEFTTGSVGHRLVFSAATISLKSRNAYGFSDFSGFAGNLYQPIAVAPPAATFFTGGVLSDPRVTQKSDNKSLAIADMVSLFDERVLLTFGVRHQQIEAESFDYNTGALLSGYDEERATPVAAAVFKPSEQVSLYANYAEGLIPGEIAPANSGGSPVINAGEVFKPFRSEQFEVGAKYDRGTLGGVVSIFQTTRPSAVVENSIFAVAGEQRNRGVELSVFGQPAPSLRVLGGLTLIEAEMTRTQNRLFDGKDAVGVPDLLANLNVEWDVPALEGVALDARVIYTSSQFANAANTVDVDSWARADIGARYRTSIGERTTTFRARFENVTDEAYWGSVGGFPGSSYLVLGAPRTLLLSAAVDFYAMSYLVAAFVLGIAGVCCLYGSWKDQLPARLRPTLVGWLLLIAAGFCWVRASGAEFGITLIFMAPALVAWVLVAINAELRQAKTRTRKANDRSEPTAPVGARSMSRHLLLFVITVPLSAVAATLFSIALAKLLPWSDLSEMTLAIILMPFLWGCVAYWAIADRRPARPVAAIVVLGLIGAATAYL